MSSKYILLVDSGCDLSRQYYEQQESSGLRCIPITYVVDGTDYPDDAGKSMSYDTFYKRIRGGAQSTTSMINILNYTTEFETYLADGYDLIYLALSSGISGSYHSAVTAADDVRERYPDRKLYVIDSKGASMGIALLAHLALQQKKLGLDIDSLHEYIEDIKMRVIHLFTVTDLMYLQRGGRISSAAAIMGSLIGVKPMLDVDKDGKLQTRSKKRGRKQALTGLVDWMETLADTSEPLTIAISHGDAKEDCDTVIAEVKKRFSVAEVLTNYIGPVIGSHSGPGTIALFFVGKERTV